MHSMRSREYSDGTTLSKLKIGIDIDSVLADTCPSWSAYMKTKHHEHNHGFDKFRLYDKLVDAWSFHSDICEQCFHDCLHDRERIMEIPLMSGAQWAVYQLAAQADLYIVTSRPDDVRDYTIAWLQDKNIFPCVKQVIFAHAKEDVCLDLGLDFMIDDSPRQIAAMRDQSETQVVIYDTLYNKDEEGLRLNNWLEVEEYLSSAITEHKYMVRSYPEE
jgi:5'(3')-deoxyribonucleotidase